MWKLSNPWLVFGTVLLIFLAFLFSLLAFIWPIEEVSVAKSGVFGDSFGVLSSLFNGLALGALVLTLTEQKNEFRRQHFENIFFEMVRLHVDMTAAIDLKMRDKSGNEIVTQGRDCFSIFYDKLKGTFYYQDTNNPKNSESQRFADAYEYFWDKWHKELGHYFRSLYTIFKYLNDSETNDKTCTPTSFALSSQTMNCWCFTTTVCPNLARRNSSHSLKHSNSSTICH